MYIKISAGTGFLAAATYNERGLSEKQQKQKKDKVTFLGGFNLLAEDAKGIAAEMAAVASRSRTEKPVWNVSMSAAKSQKLTDQQWLAAFVDYLIEAGIDPEKHQVAIWRHSDTSNDHTHGMINAVPIDGGPALKRYHNGKRAKRAAEIIDYKLQQPVFLHKNIKDELSERLESALLRQPCDAEDLSKELAERGVIVKYSENAGGVYGVTFQLADQDHKPIKGTNLKIDGKPAKWSTISAQLDANKAQYEAEIARLRQEKVDAENARRRAEQERDQARNQPARVEIREITRPDPKDKAEIEQLRHEKEAANAALRREENARKQAEIDRAEAEANAEKNRQIADRNYQIAKNLHEENTTLKQQIKAKPSQEQITDRVNRFYMMVGRDDLGNTQRSRIEKYVQRAKENNSLGIISAFLAQDFPAPGVAAAAIEKKLQTDTLAEMWPRDFVDKWSKMPKNERSLGFTTTANSDEWRNICNSQTLTPTQQDLVRSLQKMRPGSASGGEKEDKKNQIKY